MNTIIGILLGIMIPVAAFAGFFTGVHFAITPTAEKAIKYKKEIKKIIRSGKSIDTEADQDYVCRLIDEIKWEEL